MVKTEWIILLVERALILRCDWVVALSITKVDTANVSIYKLEIIQGLKWECEWCDEICGCGEITYVIIVCADDFLLHLFIASRHICGSHVDSSACWLCGIWNSRQHCVPNFTNFVSRVKLVSICRSDDVRWSSDDALKMCSLYSNRLPVVDHW